MKNNILKIMSLSVLLSLSGCSARYLSSSDPEPLPLNTTDSVAMQSLSQGMQFIPWDIKDVLVEPNSPYSAGSIIYSSIAIGGVIADISGSWMNLAQLAPNPIKRAIHLIAYIPADNIDISDEKAINDYIKLNYITPAINLSIKNEVDTKYPTKWIDKDKLIFTGNICKFRTK